MAISYLTDSQLRSQLQAGRSVEQWLGYSDEEEYRAVRFLRIDRERSGEYSVAFFEKFDDGSSDMLDVYEFEAVEPDDLHGVIARFEDFQSALDFAAEKYGACVDRYVGEGFLQDVYAEFLAQHGAPPGQS